MTNTDTSNTDPLHGFSSADIIVGSGGQTLADAAAAERHIHEVVRTSGGTITLATGEEVREEVDHCACGARRAWQRSAGAHYKSAGWSAS